MKPAATLSLDLDDLWAYLRAQGDPNWDMTPSILSLAAERLLPVLRDLDLRLTVFVVGRDLTRPVARAVAAALAEAGHEVASHSLEHHADLASKPPAEIAADLGRTAAMIADLTGKPPNGFRCPSFGVSPPLLALLAREGYRYDASLLPTSLGPLLRVLHRATMSREARRSESHSDLFGGVGRALLPLQPFRWQTSVGPLLELPVTTFPLLRTPFHMSYLHVLGSRSPALARTYFAAALRACRARGVAPSFLLHPTDVLDARDVPALAYFVGMSRPWPDKVAHVRETLERLTREYRVLPLGALARELDGAVLTTRVCKGGSGQRDELRETPPLPGEEDDQ